MYGHPAEKVRKWFNNWIEEGVVCYVLSENSEGKTVRDQRAYNTEEAEQEIKRLSADWAVANGIRNPRKVDMRTYPVPPKLF